MNNFIDFRKETVNMSKIREIRKESDRIVRVTFDNGDEKLYGTYGDADSAMRRFEDTIIQIIPCPSNVPLFNVYDNHDGSYYHEPVVSLALCADGIVRSLSVCEYIDFASDSSNYVGCFGKESLSEYPEHAPSKEGKHGI